MVGRPAGVAAGLAGRGGDRVAARRQGWAARARAIAMPWQDFRVVSGARGTAFGVWVHVVRDHGSTCKYYRGNDLASRTAVTLSVFLLRVGVLHGFAMADIAARG